MTFYFECMETILCNLAILVTIVLVIVFLSWLAGIANQIEQWDKEAEQNKVDWTGVNCEGPKIIEHETGNDVPGIERQSTYWMPIDCAPKTGQYVLLYDRNTQECCIGYWNNYMGNGCWNEKGSSYIPKPIHWMLLPTHPEQNNNP